MMNKIVPLILCFHMVNWAVSWDPKESLVLNKQGKETFFPHHVNKVGDSQITYVNSEEEETTSTYTFCPGSISHSPAAQAKSLHSFLQGKILQKNSPIGECPDIIEYNRGPVKDSNGDKIHCNLDYDKYKVHYNLEIDNEIISHTLYEYCYNDRNTFHTLYAFYDLPNPSLLNNPLLAEERNVEFELKQGLTLNDNDIDLSRYYKNTEYEPHLVAIPEFIPFAHWRRSFYQWQNIASMNKHVQATWKSLITQIESKLAQKTEHIRVYSGVYGDLMEAGSPKHLPHGKMKVPWIWWILLANKDETAGVSLIMHNYVYGPQERNIEPLCRESKCSEAGLHDAVSKVEGYNQALMYCCSASTIATLIPFPQFNNEGMLKFD